MPFPCCCHICVQVTICDFSQVSVADVAVTFNGSPWAGGTVRTTGNFCFASAGAGTYAVTVTMNGFTKTASVTLSTAPAPGATILAVRVVGGVAVAISGCTAGLAGVAVAIGGGTATTDAGGQCYVYPTTDISTGTISWTATYQGRAITRSNSFASTCAVAESFVDQIAVKVDDGCLNTGTGLPGAYVTVYQGMHAVGAGNTDGSGVIAFNPVGYGLQAANQDLLGGPADSLDVVVTYPGYATQSYSVSAICPGVGVGHSPYVTEPTLYPDSSHCCQTVCASPQGIVYPLTVYVNDGFGVVTLTASWASGVCQWRGSVQRNASTGQPGDVAHGTCGAVVSNVQVWVSFSWNGSSSIFIHCEANHCNGTNSYTIGARTDAPMVYGISGAFPISGSLWTGGTVSIASCSPLDMTLSASLSDLAANGGLWAVYGKSITLHVTE